MAGIVLTDRQRFDWLRLFRTEGVGPRTFRGLVNRFGGAGAALEALPEASRAAGRPVKPPAVADIEREIEQGRRLGVRFVALGEDGYPSPLAATRDAPPVIAVRGSLAALAKPMVALVGSRNASANGLRFTQMLARDLGDAGFVIVSGLARGIDTAAHRASLGAGTVAVLAGGHGRVYPSENEPLLDEIVDTGAAISEMPFTVEPRARDFPRRNRIVAGLAMAVVVVEAARRSGSLITARLALEEGRELFAVPGSPLDPRAEGANDLLHAGEARLCRQAQDIVCELEPMLAGGARRREGLLFEADDAASVATFGPLCDELDWLIDGEASAEASSGGASALTRADADRWAAMASEGIVEPPAHGTPDCEARIAALLGASAVAVDELARLSGHSVREVQAALMDLELQGLARRDPAGGYARS
jgi:DNA processing protein